MDPTSYSRQGAIKVDLPSIPVLYSTPLAGAVADFVSTHYDLPGSIECKLLLRGWNDTFEIRTKDGERFIFRISKRRARGDADVASETAFLAYLDSEGIPVAAAVPVRDGSLFTSAFFPEGRRPAVLFRYAEGRPSRARSSAADARANGMTLARIHDAAGGFAAGDKGRYRLDRDHMLHRPRAGQAVFFDFDEGGPGYLAYDLAVFLHACVLFEQKQHAFWHAFIEGYRAIRELPHADFEAVHLFVPIRHLWFVGEYASRIQEWGKLAVPADWIADRRYRGSW